MRIDNVEFNYVNLLRPKQFGDQDPKYSLMIVFPVDHPQVDELKQAITDAKKEKWGGRASRMTSLKPPLKEGPYVTNNGDESVPEGHYYMTISTAYNPDRPRNGQPRIVDSQKQDITDPEDIYSGCIGNVVMAIKAYDLTTSKGVTGYVQAVQVTEKRESKAGDVSADVFDVVEDGFTRDASDLFDDAA